MKKWLVSAWLTWERLFHKFYSVKPLDADNQLIYYRICKYRGRTIACSGEETLVSGDRVAELHFNNETLLNMSAGSGSIVQLAAQLIHQTKLLLPILSEKIDADPQFHGIKGVYGITMIHQGTQRLGFTVEDLPRGWFASFTRLYLSVLLSVIHPEGSKRLKMKKGFFVPKVLAMTTKELQTKYSPRRGVM